MVELKKKHNNQKNPNKTNNNNKNPNQKAKRHKVRCDPIVISGITLVDFKISQ